VTRRVLSPDEAALWRRIARNAKPLEKGPATPQAAPDIERAQPPRQAEKTARTSTAPTAQSGKPAQAQRAAPAPPSLDAATARRVRRGRMEVDGKIDLHGMRQAQAHAALERYVARARERGHRCILVITGKGLRTTQTQTQWGRDVSWDTSCDADWSVEEPGVLRRKLPLWLGMEPLRSAVFAMEEAHPRHGGSGAFYLFLRRRGA